MSDQEAESEIFGAFREYMRADFKAWARSLRLMSISPEDAKKMARFFEDAAAEMGKSETLEDADRQNVVLCLRRMARVDIGTMLTAEQRETVNMCAEWIGNELDRRKP